MSQQEEARWQLALQQMGRVYDGSAAEKAGKITEARDHYLSVLQNAEAHLTTRVAAGTRFFYMIADLPVPDEPSLTQDLAMVQLALEEARELQRTFAPALVEVAVKTKNAVRTFCMLSQVMGQLIWSRILSSSWSDWWRE